MDQKFHKNQIAAICHDQGPMLVLAGPGSGKTTVITHRVKHLTNVCGAVPSRILVITFTRAAADEMKNRYAALSGKHGVTFGTFHSIFFRILRQSYGYTLEQVLSEHEKQRVLRQIMHDAQIEALDEEEYIQQFTSQYSLMQNELQTIQSFAPEGLEKQEFIHMAQAYTAWKARMEKIDFDDMLTQCYALLSKHEQARTYWQNRFDYILVDEFQDINQAQYACLRFLATPKNNLFVVGDDDQSIYGFRGARPDFMLDFPKDFPGTKKMLLDVNYRCSTRIIHLAARSISGNVHRYDKCIQGNREIGDKINVFTAEDTAAEAEMIAEKISALLAEGISENEIAVIFRTNIQGAAFASACYRKGIPYRMRDGGMNFYEHWIAKDLLSYLYLAENPETDSALLRILNKPKRYISKDMIAQAQQLPHALLRSLFVLPQLKKWQSERLTQLEADLRQIARREPYDGLHYVRSVIGYDEYLEEYAAYRKASLPHLIEIANEITETAKGMKTAAQFAKHLDEMSRQMQEQGREQKQNAVTLTTFHSAKGLEFSVVFLPSLAEGILPYERNKDGASLEEERRLFYVGLTRTKDLLFLSFARNRYDKPVKPSRFLLELGLPENLLLRKAEAKS